MTSTSTSQMYDFMYLVPKETYHKIFPNMQQNYSNDVMLSSQPREKNQEMSEKNEDVKGENIMKKYALIGKKGLAAKSKKLTQSSHFPTAFSQHELNRRQNRQRHIHTTKTASKMDKKLDFLTQQRLSQLTGQTLKHRKPVQKDKTLASNIIHELRHIHNSQ